MSHPDHPTISSVLTGGENATASMRKQRRGDETNGMEAPVSAGYGEARVTPTGAFSPLREFVSLSSVRLVKSDPARGLGNEKAAPSGRSPCLTEPSLPAKAVR
jgi:hypothetical protein